ncbi:hypothetical protein B4U80_09503 [Leptotrombidium deliense]|uniref:Uncharacterized protein n=1 Tax=Leptotrombidium deliense TaxID=299467 RepID=A0A443RVX2_9ACAR|nr:hypothetical protein B4U80_09503 [Leptotrombidium deliense]
MYSEKLQNALDIAIEEGFHESKHL